MTVNPTKSKLSASSALVSIKQRPTFKVHSRGANDLMIDDIIRRRTADKQRRRMYEHIFRDPKSLIWDPFCVRILCSRSLALVNEIFAHCDLVDETCC